MVQPGSARSLRPPSDAGPFLQDDQLSRLLADVLLGISWSGKCYLLSLVPYYSKAQQRSIELK